MYAIRSYYVTLNPAPENHGFKFKRVDLEEQLVIDAVAENVSYTERGTVLTKGEVKISTIEHCLSALTALGVDNCLIEVNGPEAPVITSYSIHYTKLYDCF